MEADLPMDLKTQWKRARGEVEGTAFESSEAFRRSGLGVLSLLALATYPLDRRVWGIEAEILGLTLGFKVPGWVAASAVVAAVALNVSFYRGRQWTSPRPRGFRGRVGQVALAVPMVNWVYAASLPTPRTLADETPDRTWNALQLKRAGWITKFTIDAFASILGVLWLAQRLRGSLSDWVLWVTVYALLHGAMVVQIRLVVQTMDGRSRLERASAAWAGRASWLGWLPGPVVLLVVAGLARVEDGGLWDGGLTASVSRRRHWIGALERTRVPRRNAWTRRWKTMCSYRRMQRARLFAEGLVLGVWVGSFGRWPPERVVAALIGFAVMANGAVAALALIEAKSGWWVQRAEPGNALMTLMVGDRLALCAAGFCAGSLAGVGRPDLFTLGVLFFVIGSLAVQVVAQVLVMVLAVEGDGLSSTIAWSMPGVLAGVVTYWLLVTDSSSEAIFLTISALWYHISLLLVIAGPGLAAFFLPWLLEPSTWRDVVRPRTRRRTRRRLMLEGAKALFPLGGLCPPRALSALRPARSRALGDDGDRDEL